MKRIEIKDLNQDQKLSKQEMKKLSGGAAYIKLPGDDIKTDSEPVKTSEWTNISDLKINLGGN